MRKEAEGIQLLAGNVHGCIHRTQRDIGITRMTRSSTSLQYEGMKSLTWMGRAEKAFFLKRTRPQKRTRLSFCVRATHETTQTHIYIHIEKEDFC